MSSTKLDEMLTIQKTLKDKSGLGFEVGECSHKKTENKIEANPIKKTKLARGKKIHNKKEKSPIKNPNGQRYFCFNSYYFSCNRF